MLLLSRETPSLDSARFRALSEAALAGGTSIRFHARGLRMQPNIEDGDLVVVAPIKHSELRTGQIVLSDAGEGLKLHRIISVEGSRRVFASHGEDGIRCERQVTSVLGKVVEVRRAVLTESLEEKFSQIGHGQSRILRRSPTTTPSRIRRWRTAFLSTGHAMHAALIGIVFTLAVQGACFFADRTAVPGTLEDHALLNWLSLLLAPFSFLSRIYNPDGPTAVSWSNFLLVVFANACYFAAGCKTLELLFKRAHRKLEYEEAGLRQSSAT